MATHSANGVRCAPVRTWRRWASRARAVFAQPTGSFDGARWLSSAVAVFDDSTIDAVAIEVRNHVSLPLAAGAIAAGKHVWLDKPAGDDWTAFTDLMQAAKNQRLHAQLGYMFRYSPGFEQLTSLARCGALGDVFSVRAHMRTRWFRRAE